jgi:large subunit ribosomal protein L22
MSNLEAHHHFARITARKARYVADLVRGRDVNSALDILEHTHKRASSFLKGVLRSAISNATQEGRVNVNRLYIRDLQVDSGPLLQGRFRYQSGPMGRALPIRKRTSHIHLVLGEREGSAVKRGKKAAAKAAPDAQAAESGVKAEKAAEKPVKTRKTVKTEKKS